MARTPVEDEGCVMYIGINSISDDSRSVADWFSLRATSQYQPVFIALPLWLMNNDEQYFNYACSVTESIDATPQLPPSPR